jgi:thymidylate kinase
VNESALRSETHVNYSGLSKPDFGILLDVSDEKREQRMVERTKDKRSPWERPEFQIPFNQKLRQIAKREGLLILDTTNMTKQDVSEFVISEIIQHKR